MVLGAFSVCQGAVAFGGGVLVAPITSVARIAVAAVVIFVIFLVAPRLVDGRVRRRGCEICHGGDLFLDGGLELPEGGDMVVQICGQFIQF